MLSAALALAFAPCPPPPAKRHHCVADGDTVWVEGQKLRLADIDAPEMPRRARCRREADLAIRAQQRLAALLNETKAQPQFTGRHGVFGRPLVLYPQISATLIEEGLAVSYRQGKRPNWCS